MTQVYQPGSKVYAKLRGYPWWPARIEDESELPSSVLAQKPKGSQKVWSVRFFGTKDYAWMPPRQLREFDKQVAEESLEKLKGKRKEKLLERSFMEALDLVSNIDGSDDEEAEATPESSNNDMDVDGVSKRSSDSSHEESTEERPKGRGARSRRNSKSASTASTKQNAAKSGTAKSGSAKSGTTKSSTANTKSTKRRHRKIDYTDDEEEPMDIDQNGKDEGKDKIRNQNSKKRRRMSKDKSNEQVSNSDETGSDGKSESGAGEGPNGPNALDEESGANAKSKKSEAESNARSGKSQTPKASTPTEKLVHLRHKLQKLTLKDPVMDQAKVDQLFGEVESFSITIPLLKESKMGKLMKKIAALNIDPDPYKIKDRCTDLMKKWKCLLENSSQEPAEETTSPKADGKT